VSAINSWRCTPRSFRQVRLKLGRRCRQFAPPVASLIQKLACSPQRLLDLCQARPNLLGLHLQQIFTSFTGVLLGIQFEQLIGEKLILILTLNLLGSRGVNLCAQGMNPLSHL
jgi:hypothetical protein